MFLSALATLNFSLATMAGLLAAPLSFVRPCRSRAAKVAVTVLLNVAASPAAVLFAGAWYWGAGTAGGVGALLREAAVGWHVCGTYTPVVVWCVWWPAWVAGCVVALGGDASSASAVGGEGKKVKTG